MTTSSNYVSPVLTGSEAFDVGIDLMRKALEFDEVSYSMVEKKIKLQQFEYQGYFYVDDIVLIINNTATSLIDIYDYDNDFMAFGEINSYLYKYFPSEAMRLIVNSFGNSFDPTNVDEKLELQAETSKELLRIPLLDYVANTPQEGTVSEIFGTKGTLQRALLMTLITKVRITRDNNLPLAYAHGNNIIFGEIHFHFEFQNGVRRTVVLKSEVGHSPLIFPPLLDQMTQLLNELTQTEPPVTAEQLGVLYDNIKFEEKAYKHCLEINQWSTRVCENVVPDLYQKEITSMTKDTFVSFCQEYPERARWISWLSHH